MAKGITPGKAERIAEAQKVMGEALGLFDMAVLRGEIPRDAVPTWFDMIRRSRSLQDIQAVRSVLESLAIVANQQELSGRLER